MLHHLLAVMAASRHQCHFIFGGKSTIVGTCLGVQIIGMIGVGLLAMGLAYVPRI
jgi:hypothetical protein